MDALVLLDLLGSRDPSIQSYFPATGWMFDALREIDLKLGQRGMLGTLGEKKWEGWTERMTWFQKRSGGGFGWGGISDGQYRGGSWGRGWAGVGRVGETKLTGLSVFCFASDHLPFLRRGVEILHRTFPHVLLTPRVLRPLSALRAQSDLLAFSKHVFQSSLLPSLTCGTRSRTMRRRSICRRFVGGISSCASGRQSTLASSRISRLLGQRRARKESQRRRGEMSLHRQRRRRGIRSSGVAGNFDTTR